MPQDNGYKIKKESYFTPESVGEDLERGWASSAKIAKDVYG
jgi:hypothetical protein